MNTVGVDYKDIITFNLPIWNYSDSSNSNIDLIAKSSFFLFLSKLKNKIPSWLKLVFIFFLFSFLIIKLLGFNVLDVLSNNYYLKMYCYISCSLVILYQILNILLLYKFSKNNIKIPEILPDFIINWLKDLELVSKDKEYQKEYKPSTYREILMYLILLIIIIIG